MTFDTDIVREIRLGRHPQNTTRVVMDMEGVDSYSVFRLYNPYRLVVDFKATAASASGRQRHGSRPGPETPRWPALPAPLEAESPSQRPAVRAKAPEPAAGVAPRGFDRRR